MAGAGLSADDLLTVTREVENDFVGAPTGGMDQLAALRCTADHVLFCDMRTVTGEQVPFALADAGLELLIVDTREAHEHAGGEYRRRREGCEAAAAQLGVPALRDVGPADLDPALARLDDDELRRYVRHIVTENDRVLRTVDLLRDGQLEAIGPLLTESHASMRDDYRITTPALDLAVETLLGSGAVGARMTGGGFGGCCIALVPTAAGEGADHAVHEAFAAAGFHAPQIFAVTRAAPGAIRVDD
jgi:galactokinase